MSRRVKKKKKKSDRRTSRDTTPRGPLEGLFFWVSAERRRTFGVSSEKEEARYRPNEAKYGSDCVAILALKTR